MSNHKEHALLDLALSPEQQEALILHGLLASKGVYDDVRRILQGLPECAYIRVHYSSEYNDNWYDVEVDKFELLQLEGGDFKLLTTVKTTGYNNQLEVDYAPSSKYQYTTFTISRNLLS